MNQVAGLRKWQHGGNGYSFPTLNVPPLFKAYSGEKPTEREKQHFDSTRRSVGKGQLDGLSEMDRYTRSEYCLWDHKQQIRIDKCLHVLSKKFFNFVGKPPAEFAPLASLEARMQLTTAKNLHAELARFFRQSLETDTDSHQWYGMLWHGGSNAPGNDISLLLEIDDLSLCQDAYPVQHSETTRWVNCRLLASQAPTTEVGDTPDAFGMPADAKGEKLDDLTVPVLGKVILRSMNHESPCQYRYRQIGPDSYPIGKVARLGAKAAFEWLIAPERKSLTWDSTSMAAEHKEIVLAYPTDLPPVIPAMTMMFTGAHSPAMRERRFEDCAEEVISSLRSLGKPIETIDVRVFALRKVDPARTQISCHRIVSAAQLAQAAKIWRAGCGNVPPIHIRDFVSDSREPRKKPTPVTVDPAVPFPLQAIACLNTVWPRELKQPKRTKTFFAADGVDLLLGIDSGLLARAMHASVTNWPNLLSALRSSTLRWEVLALPANTASQKRFAPSILGLLLYKFNRHKGVYMRQAPFLVGRALNLADELHYRYCTHVRKKSYPPQLVGNALMATAMETPVRALALLGQRILPYQAWARTWQGEDAGLVRFFLNELRGVCDDLAPILSLEQKRTSDTEKAELLLGYLSSAKTAPQDGGATLSNP